MKTATSTFAAEHNVATVCPLDCPDSCSLDVTVQDGRITAIDGSHVNPITGGYICAKVRRFPERLYGADRLLYPAVRRGPKGLAAFARVTWEEALGTIADRMRDARERATELLPERCSCSRIRIPPGAGTRENLSAAAPAGCRAQC